MIKTYNSVSLIVLLCIRFSLIFNINDSKVFYECSTPQRLVSCYIQSLVTPDRLSQGQSSVVAGGGTLHENTMHFQFTTNSVGNLDPC